MAPGHSAAGGVADSGELRGREGLGAAGVRVVTVPGAGHIVMFDNPDAFAAAVAGRD